MWGQLGAEIKDTSEPRGAVCLEPALPLDSQLQVSKRECLNTFSLLLAAESILTDNKWIIGES